MPKNQSILDLKKFKKEDIERFFFVADEIARGYQIKENKGLTAALIFFEASTRTRMSFETACARESVYPVIMNVKIGSSLEKGETFEDTILNVAAMNPAFLVIRSGDDLDLSEMDKLVSMPILNAGWGRRGHPTQALLDAYTIYRKKNRLDNQRLLIIGDIRHSRVAASHFELANLMGYQVAVCAPRELLPEHVTFKVFSSLKEGLEWASVAMSLRVQLERHQSAFGLEDYQEKYQLNPTQLKNLSSQALIMHPGPINQGVEMTPEAINDSRSVILEQVSNGVFIRQALVREVLK